MKIINSQNFVEGYYDINSKTKIIKNKYEKEFNLLKGLKGKKIDDIVAMTIIIILFVTKEKKELLQEMCNYQWYGDRHKIQAIPYYGTTLCT